MAKKQRNFSRIFSNLPVTSKFKKTTKLNTKLILKKIVMFDITPFYWVLPHLSNDLSFHLNHRPSQGQVSVICIAGKWKNKSIGCSDHPVKVSQLPQKDKSYTEVHYTLASTLCLWPWKLKFPAPWGTGQVLCTVKLLNHC